MNAAQSLLHLLLPATCHACGSVLVGNERLLCLDCQLALAGSPMPAAGGNPTELLMYGRTGCKAAASAMRFTQQSTVQRVVHAMKFHGSAELCVAMGRDLGGTLLTSGRFDTVEALVSVPLHWTRRLRRGYNQSLLLCQGIAQVMPRTIEDSVLRRARATAQQSLRSGSQREANVTAAFTVRHARRLEGRHVLLVDDVVTTGSTLAACVDALSTIPGITISIATLCIAI